MDFLNRIERRLDMPVGEKADVMRELTAHFDELYDEFVASGMGPARAEAAAAERMGSPLNIAARLNAAHNSASWKSALLAAAPFAASAVVLACGSRLASLALAASLGAVLLTGCIRELARGRRPVWLATWMAGCFMVAWRLLPTLAAHFAPRAYLSCVELSSVVYSIAVLALAAAWRARRWRETVTPLAVVCLALGHIAFAPGQHSLIVPAVVFSTIALLMYFARCVFEVHPYGNGAQASLFVLAFVTLIYLGMGTRVRDHDHAFLAVLAVAELLCAGAVIWFVRAPRRDLKRWAITVCLMLWMVGPLGFSQFSRGHLANYPLVVSGLLLIISAFINTYLLAWYVAIPLWREGRAQRNRLTLAR